MAATPDRLSERHTLYSVYKGTLRLLAEAIRKEGGRACYLNLDGFRVGSDGEEFLSIQEVVNCICDLLRDPSDPGIQVDLMTPREAKLLSSCRSPDRTKAPTSRGRQRVTAGAVTRASASRSSERIKDLTGSAGCSIFSFSCFGRAQPGLHGKGNARLPQKINESDQLDADYS